MHTTRQNPSKKPIETYLSLKVEICWDDKWFQKLRSAMAKLDIDVKRPRKGYHITIAFMNDSKDTAAIRDAFDKKLRQCIAPQLTFDKIGLFCTKSKKEWILNLTSSAPEEGFMSFVQDLRSVAEKLNVGLEPDFLLHVTLKRIDIHKATSEQLENAIRTIECPSFTLTMKEVEYKYKGRTDDCSIGQWTLPPADQP